MTKDEVLKLALEALETGGWNKTTAAITAIKKALAQPEQILPSVYSNTHQPEQEPVAMVESVATVVSESGNQEVTMSWWHEPALPVGAKLYTTPPQRKPLTEKVIMDSTRELLIDVRWPSTFIDVWRLCEAAHGIKE